MNFCMKLYSAYKILSPAEGDGKKFQKRFKTFKTRVVQFYLVKYVKLFILSIYSLKKRTKITINTINELLSNSLFTSSTLH